MFQIQIMYIICPLGYSLFDLDTINSAEFGEVQLSCLVYKYKKKGAKLENRILAIRIFKLSDIFLT
jgi:hypothetical protein